MIVSVDWDSRDLFNLVILFKEYYSWLLKYLIV
jgi:hypothetical protein